MDSWHWHKNKARSEKMIDGFRTFRWPQNLAVYFEEGIEIIFDWLCLIRPLSVHFSRSVHKSPAPEPVICGRILKSGRKVVLLTSCDVMLVLFGPQNTRHRKKIVVGPHPDSCDNSSESCGSRKDSTGLGRGSDDMSPRAETRKRTAPEGHVFEVFHSSPLATTACSPCQLATPFCELTTTPTRAPCEQSSVSPLAGKK